MSFPNVKELLSSLQVVKIPLFCYITTTINLNINIQGICLITMSI